MKSERSVSGFWFSYIDSLAIIASIFLILLICYMGEKVIRDKPVINFHERMKEMSPKLESLGAKPEPSFEKGGWILTIADSILFNFDSADITSDGNKFIGKVGNILNKLIPNSDIYNFFRVIVGGHADSTGKEDYNLNLSDRRANNVAYFLRRKLPNISMEAIGYGEKFPKPNAITNKENRRITIILQPIATIYLESGSFLELQQFTYISDLAYDSRINNVKTGNDISVIISKNNDEKDNEKAKTIKNVTYLKIDKKDSVDKENETIYKIEFDKPSKIRKKSFLKRIIDIFRRK